MSARQLPTEAERAVYAEAARHIRETVHIIDRWPEFRVHFAYALLGQAVATCDSLGLDVEGWLAELRRVQPRPTVLVPPKRSSS